MRFQSILLLLILAIFPFTGLAQEDYEKHDLTYGLEYGVEIQGSFSNDNTPLWLNANKYGLSSLDKNNGYLRASVIRPLSTDTTRRWGIGYGLDLAATTGYTSTFVCQQAFVEARWLHGALTVGAKQMPMEMKNNKLSSGSQTLGINARPIPQVRLSLPDYWNIPFTNGWLQLKGHIAYGMQTDDKWQKDFTLGRNKRTEKVLYHSKAGYIKIGNEERFFPLSLELGLEMACLFGGNIYYPTSEGTRKVEGGKKFKDFINAFIPGGSDQADGDTYKNVEGDQLGSWMMRINYDANTWRFSLYADKFFEDHSSMFQLDYNGYGKGDNWDTKEKKRYFLYDFKDIMLGMEIDFKYDRWINGFLLEYLYSKYQSGPVYHDHTPNISSHISGQDDFYNHVTYAGWQHWGQVIGNPLYRSPIYNEDNNTRIQDNRFMAFHLGIDGRPLQNFYYRILASWQEGLGTYSYPYDKKLQNISFMIEGQYEFHEKKMKGFGARLSYGMDFGKILGNNLGFQFTLFKKGLL